MAPNAMPIATPANPASIAVYQCLHLLRAIPKVHTNINGVRMARLGQASEPLRPPACLTNLLFGELSSSSLTAPHSVQQISLPPSGSPSFRRMGTRSSHESPSGGVITSKLVLPRQSSRMSIPPFGQSNASASGVPGWITFSTTPLFPKPVRTTSPSKTNSCV